MSEVDFTLHIPRWSLQNLKTTRNGMSEPGNGLDIPFLVRSWWFTAYRWYVRSGLCKPHTILLSMGAINNREWYVRSGFRSLHTALPRAKTKNNAEWYVRVGFPSPHTALPFAKPKSNIKRYARTDFPPLHTAYEKIRLSMAPANNHKQP